MKPRQQRFFFLRIKDILKTVSECQCPSVGIQTSFGDLNPFERSHEFAELSVLIVGGPFARPTFHSLQPS